MEEIRLVEPTEAYADEIWAFRQEIIQCDAANEDQFAGCMSLDMCRCAQEWIDLCRLRRDPATCEQTGVAVPSDMYLAVRTGDNRVVGVIDLRHHIDHPVLGTWGGHCGYTVRPGERGKGYAGEMLRLNMARAAARGIASMLVTCSDHNPASERTIKQNGGVYEKTIRVDGENIKRYWIRTE